MKIEHRAYDLQTWLKMIARDGLRQPAIEGVTTIQALLDELAELRQWNATCLKNNAELESRHNELLDGRKNAFEEAAQLMEIQIQWVDSPDELAAKVIFINRSEKLCGQRHTAAKIAIGGESPRLDESG